jgi:hypothetical protein
MVAAEKKRVSGALLLRRLARAAGYPFCANNFRYYRPFSRSIYAA